MKLSSKPLAMAYVPWQTFENVLDGSCGLSQGSIFEDLIFPFIGPQAACQADAKDCPMNGNRPQANPGNHQRNNMGRSWQTQNRSCGRRCGY